MTISFTLLAVLEQVEYYFCDANLARDAFMRGRVAHGEGGWVSLALLLTFNRMKRMGLDAAAVAAVLRRSDALEVDADGERVRRRVPYVQQADE